MTQVITLNREDETVTLTNDNEEFDVVDRYKDRCPFIFLDEEVVTLTDNRMVVSGADGEELLIVADLNSSNTNHYTGVTDTPEDWIANKYFYTEEDGWVADEDFADPRDEEYWLAYLLLNKVNYLTLLIN